jgi:N-acetylmuramoyl-L-alanine amidase
MGERTVRRLGLIGVVALVVAVHSMLPASVVPVAATARRDAASDLRPTIQQKPIPFPDLRKDQTAAYSKRHAGRWAWRLDEPVVIVEHFTGGTSFQAAWNTFAANARHLGEKPGACAHFLIDTDGTIYQLADLGVRCRHTIGLDHVAIGIEHVGTSAKRVLRNAAMMRSSLRLTLWLMASERIEVRDVIGHAESLESPYHHERYSEWACWTDDDFGHRDMRIYRGLLRDLARANAVPIGPRPAWVEPRC